MKPIVKVVCGIIIHEGKYFIARRKPEKSLGGFWEFPGGKINEGENPVDALKRELMEELGMEVQSIYYFDRHEYEYDSFIIDLVAYRCQFDSATFVMKDHDICEFIILNNINRYNFAPADNYFKNILIKTK